MLATLRTSFVPCTRTVFTGISANLNDTVFTMKMTKNNRTNIIKYTISHKDVPKVEQDIVNIDSIQLNSVDQTTFDRCLQDNNISPPNKFLLSSMHATSNGSSLWSQMLTMRNRDYSIFPTLGFTYTLKKLACDLRPLEYIVWASKFPTTSHNSVIRTVRMIEDKQMCFSKYRENYLKWIANSSEVQFTLPLTERDETHNLCYPHSYHNFLKKYELDTLTNMVEYSKNRNNKLSINPYIFDDPIAQTYLIDLAFGLDGDKLLIGEVEGNQTYFEYYLSVWKELTNIGC